MSERKYSDAELELLGLWLSAKARDPSDGLDRKATGEFYRVVKLLAGANFASALEEHGISIEEQINGITRSLHTDDAAADAGIISLALDAAAALAEAQAECLAEAAAVWLHVHKADEPPADC